MEIPKIKTVLEVRNEVTKDETDLYLYGTITQHSWWDEETITAKNVKKKLNGIDSKKINVHVNSGGGDVFESIAINNLLKNHKAEIVIHIDGFAASGASVIAMAGDKIIMPKNTMMMIHKAWTYAAGNAEELRKVANDMDKIDIAVSESYMNKFVGDKEELEQLLSDETWLTAEECKDLGFCDELTEEIKEDEEEEDNKNNKSPKESILAKYQQKVVGQSGNQQSNNKNQNDVENQLTNNEDSKVIKNGIVIKTFLESFK